MRAITLRTATTKLAFWVVDNSRKTERCHGNTTSKYPWVTWPVVRVSFAKNSLNLCLICKELTKPIHQLTSAAACLICKELTKPIHQLTSAVDVPFAVNPLNLSISQKCHNASSDFECSATADSLKKWQTASGYFVCSATADSLLADCIRLLTLQFNSWLLRKMADCIRLLWLQCNSWLY